MTDLPANLGGAGRFAAVYAPSIHGPEYLVVDMGQPTMPAVIARTARVEVANLLVDHLNDDTTDLPSALVLEDLGPTFEPF